MKVSARTDYAIRAVVHLARSADAPVSASGIAAAQHIPAQFLELILADLRRAGLVNSQRGSRGGFSLVGSPAEITIADIIRAVDGPLATVRGEPPEDISYDDEAQVLQDVWIAVRVALREVLESVTLAHVASGRLPNRVRDAGLRDDAWLSR